MLESNNGYHRYPKAYKVEFDGNGHVIATDIQYQCAPGIGTLLVTAAESHIWTGVTQVGVGKGTVVSFPLCNITRISRAIGDYFSEGVHWRPVFEVDQRFMTGAEGFKAYWLTAVQKLRKHRHISNILPTPKN